MSTGPEGGDFSRLNPDLAALLVVKTLEGREMLDKIRQHLSPATDPAVAEMFAGMERLVEDRDAMYQLLIESQASHANLAQILATAVNDIQMIKDRLFGPGPNPEDN